MDSRGGGDWRGTRERSWRGGGGSGACGRVISGRSDENGSCKMEGIWAEERQEGKGQWSGGQNIGGRRAIGCSDRG